MELREQVAQRLQLIWGDDDGTWDELTTGVREDWLSVADECIRLMEWARRECHGHYFSMGAAGGCDLDPNSEMLTLPPDTWEAPDGK